METSNLSFADEKKKAEELYRKTGSLSCPFFEPEKVSLNSDGFHHLEYKPNRTPRNQAVAMLKFHLLPWALKAIKKSGTLQEYRKDLMPVGNKSARGVQDMKWVEYFGFTAIMGDGYKTRIKVILRRVGNGAVHFWSVMPDVNPGKNGNRPNLMKRGLEEE